MARVRIPFLSFSLEQLQSSNVKMDAELAILAYIALVSNIIKIVATGQGRKEVIV